MSHGLHSPPIPLALTCAVLLCLCCAPRYAAAQFPEDALKDIRQQVSDGSERYNAIHAELELNARDTWTITQIHEYLDASLWVIYDGLTYYFMQNGSLPTSLEGLQGSSYVPDWPANPYNDWKPIRVLTLAEGFSPGDVVWQICPPELYSGVKNPRPVSCELSIFGPDVKYGDLGDAHPTKSNTWAVVPEGAVFMRGQNFEKSSVTRAKFDKIIEDAKKAEEVKKN
jgi:hypothetical protein